jgi:hypothetical protein
MSRFLLVLATVSVALASSPDKVVPAINDIESWQQVGQQPYEMTWSERAENPHTLVNFEDLSGWKLELYGGAAGEFRRSREQQMWGHSVGKFVFSGPTTESRVVARPPQPIPIPGEFDSVELWGYGNRWGWEEDKTTPAADVAVLLTDARGKEFRIPLTDIRWKQWWLIHRRVSAAMLKEMTAPVALSGIEISKIGNTEPRYFFCDSLAIYREEFQPLHFATQPKRNLAPWRGQIAGLNTGTGRLPFPTREETILPRNQERDAAVRTALCRPRCDDRLRIPAGGGESGRDHGQRERRAGVPPAGGRRYPVRGHGARERGGRRAGGGQAGWGRGAGHVQVWDATGGVRAATVAKVAGARRTRRGRRGDGN